MVNHPTWKTVLSRVSMFLNCSSSSSVSAVIIGSIWPVLRFGTWNTSFISSFESISPDQENRWIKLEVVKKGECGFDRENQLIYAKGTHPFLSKVIWSSQSLTSSLSVTFS